MPCPPPFVPTYPYGPYLRFVCRTLDLTIRFDEKKFVGALSEDRLGRTGYDREKDPEYTAKMFYGYSGASHRKGPAFKAPQICRASLQSLTDTQYRTLKEMWLLWIEQGATTRLYDGRLVLEEAKPRTHAKFNPGITYTLPTSVDVEYYFPILDVVWDEFKDLGRSPSGYRLEFTLKEWDADRPVVGDVA